ncbi:conserved Plasmodium protein, unknown function [Plasmodium malariae]|uniref:Uncharacterized protein n=1 Tax=Plasmodium malariae TaxID=5858 RepID=A0A1A8WWE7_PLAMA|nr:conserved Plasmodium protein, unknown function [Plasmodium malariae]
MMSKESENPNMDEELERGTKSGKHVKEDNIIDESLINNKNDMNDKQILMKGEVAGKDDQQVEEDDQQVEEDNQQVEEDNQQVEEDDQQVEEDDPGEQDEPDEQDEQDEPDEPDEPDEQDEQDEQDESDEQDEQDESDEQDEVTECNILVIGDDNLSFSKYIIEAYPSANIYIASE